MRIESEVKLDYKDVLFKPKRSTLSSRKDVDLEREYTFKNNYTWKGVPIIAANMDTVATFEVAKKLQEFNMLTCLHKHYDTWKYVDFFLDRSVNKNYVAYSIGISDNEYSNFLRIQKETITPYNPQGSIKILCIDVANGYTERFIEFVKKVRNENPYIVIIAGNVVTPDITEQLILAGADIVKVGIGPGSVCTTRIQTGVGYPQLSAVIECADAAHGLGGRIIADGGCTCPGDVAKAFGGGADFVMLGGMLAGHDENMSLDKEGNPIFYGMSSDTAMNQYSGGVAEYRSSEGRTVNIKRKGQIECTIKDILGGLRSTCTYVGAKSLKELTKRTTFIKVTKQFNDFLVK